MLLFGLTFAIFFIIMVRDGFEGKFWDFLFMLGFCLLTAALWLWYHPL
jgi:hypothetical protein